METALFWLTIISGALGVVLTAVSALAPQTKAADGRLNRVGQACLFIAVTSSLSNVATSQLQDRKSDRERAAADSASQARTDSITRRLEQLAIKAEAIEAESERLRELQRLGLRQVDSVSAASRALANQQQRAIHDLGLSLALSRGMSDSLQASVALSRQIVDSLRLAEARAGERARQTLATVESSRNPLTSIRAPVSFGIPRNTPRQAEIVDRLYSRRRSDNRLAPVRTSGRWALVEDGSRRPIPFPAEIALDFWRGDESCEHERDGEHLLSATRRLDYNSPEVIFSPSVGVFLNWDEDEFEIRTARNVSVDDLKDACVTLGFVGGLMYSKESMIHFWGSAAITVNEFMFPQGRTASVEYRVAHDTLPGGVVAWVGRLKFDN